MVSHKCLVNCLIHAIQKPDYQPPLPSLSQKKWDKVFNWEVHKARNNFFEWMGDSLVSAALSVELCRRFPAGNEHVFTIVRSALVCNVIFAHIIHKLGISRKLIYPGSQYNRLPTTSKHFSDLFEVIVAETYRVHGFETLCVWVGDVFSSLIQVALHEVEHLPEFVSRKRTRLKATLALASSYSIARPQMGLSQPHGRRYHRSAPQKRSLTMSKLRSSTLGNTREVPIVVEEVAGSEASSEHQNIQMETPMYAARDRAGGTSSAVCAVKVKGRGSPTDPICLSDDES